MSYSFEIIGIAPVLQFFNQQQQLATQAQLSQAYLGSYCCTLDGFINAAEQVNPKPDWDWDAIVAKMVEFWLSREVDVRHWRAQFSLAEGGGHLIVARVVNYASLRREFEQLFER
jgi:hypothetical protein